MNFLISLSMIIMISPLQPERTEYWHERCRLFRAEMDTLAAGQTIFLGNSITEGFELKQFFPGDNFINRGISGDHVDGLIERLDFSVIQLKPARLFILIGINDIGAAKNNVTITTQYEQLLYELKEQIPKTDIFIQSVLPTQPEWTNCPREQVIDLNKQLMTLCLRFGYQWIDLYSHFSDKNGYLKSELTDDGLHLNENGYHLWYYILKTYYLHE